jgi:hypothetical protein
VVGGPLFCCLCYPDFDIYVTGSSILHVVSVSVGRRIAVSLKGLRKHAKTLTKNRRPPGRDLKPGPPKYREKIQSTVKQRPA